MVKAEPEEQPEQEVELDPLPRIHTASTAALAAQKGTGPAVQYRTRTHTAVHTPGLPLADGGSLGHPSAAVVLTRWVVLCPQWLTGQSFPQGTLAGTESQVRRECSTVHAENIDCPPT